MGKEKIPIKLTSGRKITVPKDACDAVNMDVGDHFILEVKGNDGELTLRPLEDYEVVDK